ncbi:MAG: hypothetical protein MUP15_03230, partial [Dehalococcoidia bacterium]|nr:hypothetical protein [Dehalococcoidia bacterium]
KTLGITGKNIRLMPWQCLEDTYPEDLLVQALSDLFGLTLDEQLPSDGRAKIIHRLLQRNDTKKGWKKPLAAAVAARMAPDNIPPAFSSLLDDVYALIPKGG